jgi:phosphohistidine phosphatase
MRIAVPHSAGNPHCMKRLHLIRHAKSSWTDANLSDFNRPLNERGVKDAPEMARRLAARFSPDMLLVSTARRTQETAHYFASVFPSVAVHYNALLYEASLPTLINAVASLPPTCDEVAIIAHNPGMTLLLGYLAHQYVDMPTCAIASVQLHIEEWQHAGENCATLEWYDYPKNQSA